MRDYLKTGITLMVITIIAALVLSVVYTIVEEPIANAELGAKLAAIRNVLTDADSGELLIAEESIPETASELAEFEWFPEGFTASEGIIYQAVDSQGRVESPAYKFLKDDGSEVFVAIGIAVGYGGDVKSMAAFVKDSDGVHLNGIKVLEYSQETPGLGANIANDSVQKRFYPIDSQGLQKSIKVDKDAGVTPIGDQIDIRKREDGIVTVSDVMTGATITPRAVAFSLNAISEFLEKAGVR
ncbi:MAG: RnfABCDGE type electron transport complex subunit G [Mesotoga sp.]|jgi:electron transport complex protein RnfG|uniref:RnfABCDGE type electron transport complex subunit G n=1 Tax=unclassified Mesotoga TaxID=1184398 RepID=UPI000EF2740E|nr:MULTISPECIES: RnfABCDGE type electron transport complex subunit G [unclassified Mesotoga]MDI9367913.1 RnfABCDGE type electron transport complex subunit G [Thermotogota bacterium]NLT46399.1 RnfABCDGE type electron transport complex subunit G [Thermotogaceae bacterium]MDD2333810.1 RnfABCDGE type electron transport complex subunit G [Mesotoga sp.]MDD3680891.1 RnfABCDGE type electron transport complex subunit G [Mesotoga sp.]MDD4207751.1 RnfABCDGE type electron transport complex subunit G [Meso